MSALHTKTGKAALPLTDRDQDHVEPGARGDSVTTPSATRKGVRRGGGTRSQRAVLYWVALVVGAVACWACYPYVATTSYLLSCCTFTSLSHWGWARLQPAEAARAAPLLSRRTMASIACSLFNCVAADVLMTRYVRRTDLLYTNTGTYPTLLEAAWIFVLPLPMLFLHDAWFYMCHVALHKIKPLYRWVHAIHHQRHAPVCWDLFYMHPLECLVAVVVPFLMTPRILPVHRIIWEGPHPTTNSACKKRHVLPPPALLLVLSTRDLPRMCLPFCWSSLHVIYLECACPVHPFSTGTTCCTMLHWSLRHPLPLLPLRVQSW